MIGMDVETARSLVLTMRQRSSEMVQIGIAIDQKLASAAWAGPGADRFRSMWSGHLRRSLNATAGALADQADLLERNAQAQETTSQQLAGKQGNIRGQGGSPGAVDGAVNGTGSSGAPVNGVHHVLDAMDLAWAAMKNDPTKIPQGWRELTSAELASYGLNKGDLHDPRTGFDAHVYRRADGRLAVGFKGTENLVDDKNNLTVSGVVGMAFQPANPDMYNNVQAITGWSVQDGASARLAIKLRAGMISKGEDPSEVTYTGISLGGRNAMIAGLVTGNEVLATNPLNVSEEAYRRAEKMKIGTGEPARITIIRDSKDPVSKLTPNGLPASVYDEYSFKDTKKSDRSIWLWDHPKNEYSEVVRAHGMDSVRRGYRQAVIDAGNRAELEAADAARKEIVK